jgi:hypothetical protein
MEKEFIIRSYGYCELALLYFPNSNKRSASTQLGRWMQQNEKLKMQLLALGYKPRKKILTPSQVKLIIELFGEP